MKKNLLFLACIVVAVIAGGQTNLDVPQKMLQKNLEPGGFDGQPVMPESMLSEANIGTTWYDLQTYGAMPQRIYAYPDGSIGAVWMMAFETATWIDRGAGYNYFDGTQWGTLPAQQIETIRTGWPCYAPLGPNGEVVASHAQPAADWVILINKRTSKGQGNWIESSVAGPEAGIGIVWPSMVTGGTDHNTIHLLARTYGNPYMGQDGALLYYRSQDSGTTWDIQNHFFEDLGSDYFVNIDADGYAWAQPRGNTLAFSVGFDSNHACFMKSLDNGNTWEFTEVYNCPFYPPPGGATPDFGAGDGTQAISIDADNNVHLTYGRMVYLFNDAGELLFYPATDGLIYWNETMPPLDTTIISSYTTQFLMNSGNLVGWVVDPGITGIIEFPNYYSSLTSHPQMLIDDNDRIFVLWMGAAPDYNNTEWNFRHIYGNSSNDGGLTWNGIQDFNLDLLYIFSECVYPAMAPAIVNGQFHFLFQNDNLPGIFVWAAQQANAGENYITYMGKDTQFLTGVNDDQKNKTGSLEVSQNYPNPLVNLTFIDVLMAEPGPVKFIVSDITGRIVFEEDFITESNDKLRIRFENKDLNTGIYFYAVRSGAGTVTRKMIVN